MKTFIFIFYWKNNIYNSNKKLHQGTVGRYLILNVSLSSTPEVDLFPFEDRKNIERFFCKENVKINTAGFEPAPFENIPSGLTAKSIHLFSFFYP